ncbi:RNA-binding protein rnp-4-like [Zophobas morio]|uniref:RNA-binding protein rnp-4-like n=1 Tax=Zophobas morio TaxID=2755281 RepID=UPI003082DF27
MSDYEDDVTERVKSQVTLRKGRGFQNKRDQDLGSFESIESKNEKNVGIEQRSVEGWILIITGLHEEVAEDHIYNKFGDYGEIKNLHLNVDRRTGFVKGYALIEYETHSEARAALERLNNQDLLGCKMSVDWAFVKPPYLTEERGRRHSSRRSDRSGRRRGRSPSDY